MPHRSKSKSIPRAIAISIVLLTVAAIVYTPFWWSARQSERLTRGLLDGASEVVKKLGPVVTVDRTLILQEKAAVMELITHKQLFEHKAEWKSTWLNSTKTVALEGRFMASAGFDLNDRIVIDFDTMRQIVRVSYPPPRIIALEVENLRSSEESGWWNRISDEDRNKIMSDFKAEARERIAEKTPLLENAVKDLRSQLESMLAPTGYRIEFDERPTAAQTPALP